MGLLDRFKKAPKKDNALHSAKQNSAKMEEAASATSAAKSAQAKVSKKSVSTGTDTIVQPMVSGYSAVLLRPVVTEKSTVTGAYYFNVAKTATKNEVAKAFKARYGKMPRKVNIINVMGKTKVRGRTVGKRADWKKAIVYLNKGETVDTTK